MRLLSRFAPVLGVVTAACMLTAAASPALAQSVFPGSNQSTDIMVGLGLAAVNGLLNWGFHQLGKQKGAAAVALNTAAALLPFARAGIHVDPSSPVASLLDEAFTGAQQVLINSSLPAGVQPLKVTPPAQTPTKAPVAAPAPAPAPAPDPNAARVAALQAQQQQIAAELASLGAPA